MDGTGLLLPTDYARWQERLAREFFDGKSGQPVAMFVDRNELDLLAGPGEDGARSLASAVRGLVDFSGGRAMFSPISALARRWATGERDVPPPTLPVLAISVLAASEMHRDKAAPTHDYYTRLASALLPDGDGEKHADLRRDLRQRGAFLDVVKMWQTLDLWLKQQEGAFGVSTIQPAVGGHKRIAYPLSQTLLRRSDRAALTRFFARLDLANAGVPKPEPLMRLLSLWANRRQQGFSRRFLQSVDDPALAEIMEPLVHGLAESWDGAIVTEDGLRRLELRLTIDIDRRDAWWVVPTVAGGPDDVLSVDGSDILITAPRHAQFYEAEGLPPVTADALLNGITARGSACLAEYHPADVLVFAESAGAGGYLLVDAAQAYEQHIFATRSEFCDDIEAFLDLGADRGWRPLARDFANEILPGHAIYYEVTFSDRERFQEARSLMDGRIAANIQLGTIARPRLINGLPVFRNLSRNTFIQGGEPDLDLPVGEGSRNVTVTLDADASQTFTAAGFPIPLSVRGGFSNGQHTIEADGEELTFEVTRGIGADWAPPGVGSVGWIGDQLGTGSPESIRGAVTGEGSDPADVLIRRKAEHNWIIDQSGHLTEIEEPSAPSFLNEGEFNDANFLYFEVSRNRGSWLLQKRLRGWEVTRLLPQEPELHELTPEDRSIWAQAAGAVTTDDVLWHRYVEAWGSVCGH